MCPQRGKALQDGAVWILDVQHDVEMEYYFDVAMNLETLFREDLGNLYLGRNLYGITYFLVYLQTLFTSKLVFKQDNLSNCAQKVFTIRILFIAEEYLLARFPSSIPRSNGA